MSGLRLLEIGRAALAGPATALAAAVRTGDVVSGDDGGEAGLFAPDGRRRTSFRLPCGVVSADISARGERVALCGSDGEVHVYAPDGEAIWTTQLGAPHLVRLDPSGESLFLVEPDSGHVAVWNARGRRMGTFAVPNPVASCVVNPRDGGLFVSTARGLLARFTAWGEQVWALDRGRHTGTLAVDARSSLLVVAAFAQGAEALLPHVGSPFGGFDVGRSVEGCAVARRHVLLGTADGTAVLLDRAGRVLGDLRLGGRPLALTMRDDGATATARCDDGGVRFLRIAAEGESVAAAPRRSIGASASADHPVPREAFRRRIQAAGSVVRPPRVALSPSGDRAAVAGGARHAALLTRGGEQLAETVHDGYALDLHVLPDGSALLLTSRELRLLRASRSEPVRSFPLDQWRGTLSPCGGYAALLDEVGAARLLETAGGRDLASLEGDRGDPVRVLLGHGPRMALQVRSGVVLLAGTGADAAIPAGAAVLAAAAETGPVLVAGLELAVHGWDGRRRWTHSLGVPADTVAPLRDGGLLCAGPGEVTRLDAGGSVVARFAPPAGTLAAVAEDAAHRPALVFRDGRRVTAQDARGTVLWHAAFPGTVSAVAAGLGGRIVLVATGEDVVLVDATPAAEGAAAPAGPGRARLDASGAPSVTFPA